MLWSGVPAGQILSHKQLRKASCFLRKGCMLQEAHAAQGPAGEGKTGRADGSALQGASPGGSWQVTPQAPAWLRAAVQMGLGGRVAL